MAFECRKCRFTCPKLHMIIKHNVIHAREKIAVLEEENKLCSKTWFVPKDRNTAEGETQCVISNTVNNIEIQQDRSRADNISAADKSDSYSNLRKVRINVPTSDRELNSDKDYPKVISNKENFIPSEKYSIGNDSIENRDTNLTCLICNTVFQEITLFENHVRMHTLSANLKTNISCRSDIFKFACEHCEFKCVDIKEFDLHKKSHYTHMCKKCSRYFRTNSQLQRHDNKEHSKPYICEICPFQTKYQPTLSRHVKNTHSETDDTVSHECKICKYLCISNSELIEHMGRHKYSYNCKLCSRKFKSNEALKYHKLFHNKQEYVKKDFECLKCGRKCSSKGNLQLHMAAHSKEKPFHCTLCNYKSKWKSNLMVHMKRIHNEHKSRQGEQLKNNVNCNKSKSQSSFKTQINGNYPITDDTEYDRTERFFHCSFCEFRSKFSGNLDRHTLRHHKDKYIEANRGKILRIVLYKKKEEKIIEKGKTSTSEIKAIGTSQRKKKTFAELYSCNLCFYKSVYKGSLTKHMLAYHSKVNNASQDKSKKNIKKVALSNKKEKSLKNESNRKPKTNRYFACRYCDYTSKWNSRDVCIHMKNIHGKDRTAIIRNGKSATKKIKEKTKDKKNGTFERLSQFGCSYCNYISKRSSNDVHKHMLDVHGKDGNVITKKVVKKIIKTVKKTGSTKKK